jgi:hypothetical protein
MNVEWFETEKTTEAQRHREGTQREETQRRRDAEAQSHSLATA